MCVVKSKWPSVVFLHEGGRVVHDTRPGGRAGGTWDRISVASVHQARLQEMPQA
jgi:hypothetical protein